MGWLVIRISRPRLRVLMLSNPLNRVMLCDEALDCFRFAIGPQNIDTPAKPGVFPRYESWSLLGHRSNMRLWEPGSRQSSCHNHPREVRDLRAVQARSFRASARVTPRDSARRGCRPSPIVRANDVFLPWGCPRAGRIADGRGPMSPDAQQRAVAAQNRRRLSVKSLAYRCAGRCDCAIRK